MSSPPSDRITELFEEVLASARTPERGKVVPTSAFAHYSPTGNARSLSALSANAESLIAVLLERALFHRQSINQFASPTSSEIARIRIAIEHWLDDLGMALQSDRTDIECERILLPANQALLDTIDSTLRSHLVEAPHAIVSEQYSVEMQSEVLHVDLAALLDPVLDLGCGQDAGLVTWLRQRKANAIGVDRFVDSVPGCLKADWLELPYLPNQFGTVLAHLSFSLHFLHQHLRPDGEASAYARAYMAILGSLRSSGRFIYAPGLPFIEQLLPAERYKIAKHPIRQLPTDAQGAAIFEQALGESPMYAAHVTRV